MENINKSLFLDYAVVGWIHFLARFSFLRVWLFPLLGLPRAQFIYDVIIMSEH